MTAVEFLEILRAERPEIAWPRIQQRVARFGGNVVFRHRGTETNAFLWGISEEVASICDRDLALWRRVSWRAWRVVDTLNPRRRRLVSEARKEVTAILKGMAP